jgi:intracellular sulfur oxidation DsrE/DsrF family protein
MRIWTLAAVMAFGIGGMVGVSHAQTASTTANDAAALQGLKEVKLAFDVTADDARRLTSVLDVIEETRVSLAKQGVTPHIVVTFRGPATKLVQTDQTLMKPEDRAQAEAIAAKIKALSTAAGIDSVEQCSIAVRGAGTKPENVVPGIKVVGNGWISLAAYQSKGYAYIAP